MVGVKRHGLPSTDSIPFFWNLGGGQSNFIRKIYDYNTGNLLQTIYSKDSIANIIPRYLNFHPLNPDSSYLFAHQTGNELEGTFIWGYNFLQLD